MASPIKCLDLDDISGQLKPEGWLYFVFILYTMLIGGTILLAIRERRTDLIYYWLFERGYTILFIYLVQNYTGCRLEFHFMMHALFGGLVV